MSKKNGVEYMLVFDSDGHGNLKYRSHMSELKEPAWRALLAEYQAKAGDELPPHWKFIDFYQRGR